MIVLLPPCICGCGHRAEELHHVVYQAELKRVAGRDTARADTLRCDPRDMVPMTTVCHERHHCRSKPLSLAVLPDAAFEFAVEVLGAGRAYNWLRRRYVGEDTRLDALLDDERRAA